MPKFLTSALVAIVGAVVANLIVLYAIGPFVNNPAMPLHALSFPTVTMLTVIGAIGAVIVYAVLRMFLQKPNTPFIWVSVIVLLVSFIPDYMIIGQTTGPFAGGTLPNALVLMLMHVVAAIIIVWSLVKLWGARVK
jgi:hypothetical protein